MARTSNKDKAIAYAAEHGIILTVEDRDNFDGDYAANVWVCECCALLITNGDDSGCRDFHNHTHPDCDPAVRHLTGLKHRVGYFDMICNGCGMILRDGVDVYGAIRQTN